MNKKIKELAEQATRRYDRLGFEIPFAQPDLEEFAELIVRDIQAILTDAELLYIHSQETDFRSKSQTDGAVAAIQYISNKIKQRFGE